MSTVMGVCFYITHRWESDDRSLKAPSGISDMSLPWRDLTQDERRRGREKKRGHCFLLYSCLQVCAMCDVGVGACWDRYSQQT